MSYADGLLSTGGIIYETSSTPSSVGVLGDPAVVVAGLSTWLGSNSIAGISG
jgi:hypothetical protein